MSHRLRMSAEVGDWLTELCSSESGTAAEVGATLAAVLDAGDVADLAFVTDLGAPQEVEPGDRLAAVDAAYQDLLAWLQLLRQQAAEAGSFRTASRVRISPAGTEPLPWTEEEIAEATQRETELKARSQRYQRDVDAFRTRKEAVKARYTAASATRDIQLAIRASADALARAGLNESEQPDVGEAAQAETDLAAADRDLATASAELSDLLGEAATLRRSIVSGLSDDHGTPRGSADVTAGLLEVRASPFAADIRLLCAFEPAGTLTLLAVLDGEASVDEHRIQAIGLAGELLEEIRTEGWPAEIGHVTVADTATFLARFFPDLGSSVAARSAALAAADTIAGLRRRHEFGLADMAAATGLTEAALWKLENQDLRSARLDDVAAYVQGLGARLELTAVLDGDGPDGSGQVILY
jgi:hypothetical protein